MLLRVRGEESTAHEKEDREYNIRIVEGLLNSRQADDFILSLD
jgi:hypothetical protein